VSDLKIIIIGVGKILLTVCLFALVAQAELEWENNEIGRLKVHMANAAELTSAKLRRSFSYRPFTRRTIHRDELDDLQDEESEADSGSETADWVLRRARRAQEEEGEVDEVDQEEADRRDSAAMEMDVEEDEVLNEEENEDVDMDQKSDEDSDKENMDGNRVW
jgi:hypothetical protein